MIPAFSLTVQATQNLPNVKLSEDGVLSWDTIPGVSKYYYDLDTAGGMIEETRVDLYEKCHDYLLKRGLYEVGVRSAGGDYVWKGTYNYQPPKSLSNPTNLHWDGMTAKWDPVPNATSYQVVLYREGMNESVTRRTVNGNTCDFSEIWDQYKQENRDKRHYFVVQASGSLEYSASDKIQSLYETVDYSGLENDLHRVTVFEGSANPEWAKKGETVTIQFTGSTKPFYGHVYGFASWWSKGNITFANRTAATTTFTMPGSDVEIEAQTSLRDPYRSIFYNVSSEVPSFDYSGLPNPFQDVNKSMDCYVPVLWAYHTVPQVTTGTDATHFAPKNTVKRCEAVTFLWRAMGRPDPKSTNNPFKDVKSSDYYFLPVLWANENGITNGTTANTFSPNDTLTTAHMITFLYRTQNPGKNGWYQEASNWAANGYGGKPFGVSISVNNSTDCPRGSVVSFLYECVGKVKLKSVNKLFLTSELYVGVDDINSDSDGIKHIDGYVYSGYLAEGKKVSVRSYDPQTGEATNTAAVVKSLKKWGRSVSNASPGESVDIVFQNTPDIKIGDVLVNDLNPSTKLYTVKGTYVGTLEINNKRRTPITMNNIFGYAFGRSQIRGFYQDLNGGDIQPGETRTGVKLTAENPVTWVVGQTLTVTAGPDRIGTFTITDVQIPE